MAPKKNKAVAKKTATSTKKTVKAQKPAVAKKTAASTKKAIKAAKSTATDEIIRNKKMTPHLDYEIPKLLVYPHKRNINVTDVLHLQIPVLQAPAPELGSWILRKKGRRRKEPGGPIGCIGSTSQGL